MNTSTNNFSQRGPSRMKDPYADSLLFGNDVVDAYCPLDFLLNEM
jgi:hypothetical protein